MTYPIFKMLKIPEFQSSVAHNFFNTEHFLEKTDENEIYRLKKTPVYLY